MEAVQPIDRAALESELDFARSYLRKVDPRAEIRDYRLHVIVPPVSCEPCIRMEVLWNGTDDTMRSWYTIL